MRCKAWEEAEQAVVDREDLQEVLRQGIGNWQSNRKMEEGRDRRMGSIGSSRVSRPTRRSIGH